jgi:hypothetical protein
MSFTAAPLPWEGNALAVPSPGNSVRQIETRSPTTGAGALAAVATTDLVTTVSAAMAKRFAGEFDLILQDPPFPELFGSQADAEEWLERPAMALDQRKPIDLLSTPAGVEVVEAHLGRLEHGVYT